MAMPRTESSLPFPPLNKIPLHKLPWSGRDGERYGDYDSATGEYVITRPDTPSPWYNYLTNGTFTGYISNTGGGTCFFDDAQHRRVLPTNLHNRPIDQPGRWIYIKDSVTGRHWSASWAPVYTPVSQYKYRCRVAAGYTTIESEYQGIATRTTYFVAPGAPCEIWSLEVKNVSSRARALDVFPYAEFILWSQPRDMNLDAAFKCTDIVSDGGVVIHRSLYDFTADNYGWAPQYAFFGSSLRPRSFDVAVDAFVGLYRGYAAPLAVRNGRCSNYVNRGGEPCAALHFSLKLRPGQTQRINFALGYADGESRCASLARRCTQDTWVDRQFATLKSRWRAYLNLFRARTGDPVLDVPFNYFAPVQSAMTFLLSRSLSPYQLSGSRGLGFRDSIQDTLGAMPREGRKAGELIATLLTTVRPAGDSCHTFYPAEKRGQGEGCWDDHLWPALAVGQYVRESGDTKFLQRTLPYWESSEKGSVLEHIERSFQFTEKHLGRHGLPLLGHADWNDCLNAFSGAESVFTAGLYCYAAREIEELYSFLGERRRAARMAQRFKTMAERINRTCWDGEWYVRLLLKDGAKVGSRKNEFGKIFIESNVWAVMSGVARGERAVRAMDSVRKHLGTPYGFRLCHPTFPYYDKSIGSISVFSPGLKENGSIFCHTNPWVTCAEAAIGRGKLAYDSFARLSPFTKNKIQSIHGGEPYVINQMIAMPPNKEAGRARNPWLTGSASWFYLAMSEAILGVRADYGGLRVDPCVPGWRRFEIRRVFRGVTYAITVHNPRGIEKGVSFIEVGGARSAGNVIPPPRKGVRTVKVGVHMGKA